MACARVRCKRRVDSVAASPREYLVRRAAKNVISPPQTPPPKKQQCKNQECLASYKKKLIACARVRCKRRVDSVAASPREYLVRRAAKNVISPPQNPPKPTAVYKPWSNYLWAKNQQWKVKKLPSKPPQLSRTRQDQQAPPEVRHWHPKIWGKCLVACVPLQVTMRSIQLSWWVCLTCLTI